VEISVKKTHVKSAVVALFSLALAVPQLSAEEAKAVIAGVSIAADPALVELVPQAYSDRGNIIGAITPVNRPAGFRDENGDIVGSQIDIFKAAAIKLGLEPVVEAAGTGGADVVGTQAGRYDMTIGTGSFKSRQEVLNMVEYYRGGAGILVQPGNPKNIQSSEDFCGLTVAVAPGVIQEQFLVTQDEECKAAGKPAIDIQRIGESTHMAVASKRADASYETLATVQYLVGQDPERFEIGGEPKWLAPNGFGFVKENTEIMEAWMASVQSLIDDGTYAAILKEWNQELAAVEKVTLNESTF
jgi:polar amino acid transport system substrate-binding protein